MFMVPTAKPAKTDTRTTVQHIQQTSALCIGYMPEGCAITTSGFRWGPDRKLTVLRLWTGSNENTFCHLRQQNCRTSRPKVEPKYINDRQIGTSTNKELDRFVLLTNGRTWGFVNDHFDNWKLASSPI